MHTEHHSRIATPGGFGLVLGETFLFRALALESLLGAFVELALEGSLLLLVEASRREAEESLLRKSGTNPDILQGPS